MCGDMENAKEAHMIEGMSLEQAYTAYKGGSLRTLLAINVAKYGQCGCVNVWVAGCSNSAHTAMRQDMLSAVGHDCSFCACVGCSEGNCCGGC